MFLRTFSFLFILIYCTSCDYLSFTKSKNQHVLDTVIDFTSVDTYPSFTVCDSIIEKQAKFTCFKNTIHKKIGEQLNQHTFKIQDSINETIYVDVLIDAKGKIILDSMHSTENIKNQLPALDSVLAITVDNLPRVFAANKRGVPVATKYRLPILIQLKE